MKPRLNPGSPTVTRLPIQALFNKTVSYHSAHRTAKKRLHAESGHEAATASLTTSKAAQPVSLLNVPILIVLIFSFAAYWTRSA
jgi:hypothetical protein